MDNYRGKENRDYRPTSNTAPLRPDFNETEKLKRDLEKLKREKEIER
jgi:hypothetical protein